MKNTANCKGMKVITKKGETCVCVEYRGNTDIDVCFYDEDGNKYAELFHVRKDRFINGSLSSTPRKKNENNSINIAKKKVSTAQQAGNIAALQSASILNMTKVMNNGCSCTCIRYGGNCDCDFKFDDGTIVEHKTKVAFMNGTLGNPNKRRGDCTGLEVTMNDGELARCIAYRSAIDIDVLFVIDNTIVEHRQKREFINGEIRKPTKL